MSTQELVNKLDRLQYWIDISGNQAVKNRLVREQEELEYSLYLAERDR